jgi:nucleoside-diphosphate-sugar epimerase
MKFLVTGGVGRLGSELVKLITSENHKVVVFDLPNAMWETVDTLNLIESVKGDVTDPDVVREVCEDVDIVMHLAALLPPRSESARDLTFKVNVEGTRNIAEAVKEKGSTIVFASSVSTYGITEADLPPIHESHSLRAHDIYSESKIRAESVLHESGVNYVIMRVAPIVMADVIEPQDVIPYKADQRVEFILVSDVALAFYKTATSSLITKNTLNIAGGESWQMTGREFIEGFYSALGVEVEVKYSDEYTAVDWYDTSRSSFLGYQRTYFNDFLNRLKVLGEELGLR